MIQHCTNKFCGCLAQIESKNESGKTSEDKVHLIKKFVLFANLCQLFQDSNYKLFVNFLA